MRLINIQESKLRELYVEKGYSLRTVAKEYACDHGAIVRALKRFGIPVRHPTAERDLPKHDLKTMYQDEKLSTYAIAAKFHCDPKTVYKYLKKYRIATRPMRLIELGEATLRRLYLEERKSLKDIAVTYSYSPAGILKKQKEYGITSRTTSETSTKHPKYDFAGSREDKAYMIGFRIGDLGVRNKTNLVHISSGTTKDDQIRLIHDLFSPHGPVWVGKKNEQGACNVSSSVNRSFSFLLPKHRTIPKWILRSRSLFFSFLAGYTDAEGNFQVAGGSGRFRLRSYDSGILQNLHSGLERFGIPATYSLASKAGTNARGVRQNEDCWCLAVTRKESLYAMLVLLLPLLRHQKRLADAKEAMNNVMQRIR